MQDTSIPPELPRWLEEHCFRLSVSSKTQLQTQSQQVTTTTTTTTTASRSDDIISNLNLNLRRLNRPMMEALVHALEQTNQIQIINMTSTLLVPISSVSSSQQPHDNDTTTTTVSVPIGADDTLIPLAQLLRHHTSLQVIHLSYNKLMNVTCLGRALMTNTTLQELYLDYNQISEESILAIIEGLACNHQQTCLQVLNLNSNRLGDIAGHGLVRVLKINTSLKRLLLTNNRFGSSTIYAFGQVLQHHNVTLHELTLDENPGIYHHNMLPKIDYWLQANRAGRYLLQYTQPTPPLGLWPFVLENISSNPRYYLLQQQLPNMGHNPPTIFTTTMTSSTTRRSINDNSS